MTMHAETVKNNLENQWEKCEKSCDLYTVFPNIKNSFTIGYKCMKNLRIVKLIFS